MPVATVKAPMTSHPVRLMPIGADPQAAGGVHFRVWAPGCKRLQLQLQKANDAASAPLPLQPDDGGYFSLIHSDAAAGDRYWFLADSDETRLPDPASRFQPEGPHGPSQIVDPTEYPWHDADWPGVKLKGQVIYEMHIGTFTREGTWAAAMRELPELQSAGITLVEIMPISEFPGRFNWGYDGVALYAPAHEYGCPDDVRRFIDRAHQLGIGVILDVVYNHLGPDGNYLGRFAPQYFTDKHKTDWGAALNFYGQDSGPVREFFIHNAGYWIREFHFDGLRLDATQNIYDESNDHVIAALTRRAREEAAGRSIVVVAENEPQEAKTVRPPQKSGYGLDGLWNDDFHHSALVALRGRNEAYYSDYRGCANELLSACKYGYLYQGQWSQWQQKPRGTPALDISPWAFINYLENHDQVANSLRGLRISQLASPGRFRALTALLLLGPGTPMLFQGQEFGATTPFLFFANHNPELASLVHKGRKEFLSQFPSINQPEAMALIPDPAAHATFEQCQLSLEERQTNEPVYRLHKDLLQLRKTEVAIQPRDTRWFDGAVFSDDVLLLRYFGGTPADDRLLLVNLGEDHRMYILPEPLLAPPENMQWTTRWSSEAVAYSGCGTPQLIMNDQWKILGESALWLAPEKRTAEKNSE